MHLRIFITGWRILERSTYLSCACQRGPSWSWLDRWLLLPYVYTQLLERLTYADWVVYFYKIYSNILYIFLHWVLTCVQSGQTLDGSTLFSRVLYSINVSIIFRGGSEVVGEFFQSFLSELPCMYHPISLGVYTLVSRSSTIWPLFRWRFRGIVLVSHFLVITGALELCEGMLCFVPGNLLPVFFFHRLVTEKVVTVFFPSLLRDFL